MTGRSLLPQLRATPANGLVDPTRDAVFTGMERHANARAGFLGYPMRAIRTADFLLIRNLRPDRWPAGDPEKFADIDNGPSKTWLLEHRGDPAAARLFDLATAKRPEWEFYDLRKDPDQLHNVADDPALAAERARLAERLARKLAETGDPRASDRGDDSFDSFYFNGNPPEKKTTDSPTPKDISERRWWKEALVYQIYPRSFQDSNGDGIGDLNGITSRLDYLRDLGVDVLWLSPIYRSPNDDNGYDISDFQAIMDEFGTMADFDRMLGEAHKRVLRVVMDLVVNHTSDEHPWFAETRSSLTSPKHDYYIWRPGKNGGPPNNWASYFGGSAWEKNEATGEYYLHLFSRKQPDLNWSNPEVRQQILAMMRWWLDKGIDGFRMDVVNFLAKAPGFPDAPQAPNETLKPLVLGGKLYANQPGTHEILQEMNREVLSHYDAMSVGECHYITPEMALNFVEPERHELNMVFQFDLIQQATRGDMTALVNKWYATYRRRGNGWNTITLNNHDTPRAVSAFGDDGRHRIESAKLIALFLLTSPGTPYLFQGEELGMTNVRFPAIGDYRDIATLSRYRELVAAGTPPAQALVQVQPKSRDNARTPMQWDDSPNAGFTTGAPWIRVNENFAHINARQQQGDRGSVLNFYRDLIRLRRADTTLVYGDYAVLATHHKNVFAYTRVLDGECRLVILNWSGEVVDGLELPELAGRPARQLLSNYADDAGDTLIHLRLRPWEARLVAIARPSE